MTVPYYSDDLVTLFLGDCLEVTEWLAADVLVMDPPYGRSWEQGEMGARRRRPTAPRYSRHLGIAGDKDTSVRDSILSLWGDRPAVVFGDLMLPPPTGTKQVLIYQKPPDAGARGAMAGFRRDVEAVYLLGKHRSAIGGRSSVLTTTEPCVGNPSSPAGRYGHPHAKPDDVMWQIMEACPPGVVADPCAGSGATLLAARKTGRPAVGVELVEKYAEIIAKRLDQGCLDLASLGCV